ncbi:MAG: hypothetical protein KF889_22430 [Alphaproteobacteria bacterium]|nr:hypothetical protein [Alphaproteobacteria bacterium]MCW5743493.1 hypothetical protein [Alphaproteobacteria bacterium]
MITVVLAIVVLMMLGMVVATFSGMRMIDRAIENPADAVPSMMSSVVWMALPPLLITALGIAAFVWVIRRFRHGDQALLRNGVAGTATVLSVRDTGTTINRVHAVVELGLLVTIAGRTPFNVKTETMIARMNWGRVRPGMQLAVRVDPANNSRIAIDWSGGAANPLLAAMATPAAVAGGAAYMTPGAQDAFRVAAVRSAADIVAQGRPAEAVIQSLAHTGATVAQMAPPGAYAPDMADDPMVRITLRVEPPGGAPFTTDGLFRVPKAKLGMLALGGRVPVAVISGDRDSATIDWARL